jgi:hypothetical protein
MIIPRSRILANLVTEKVDVRCSSIQALKCAWYDIRLSDKESEDSHHGLYTTRYKSASTQPISLRSPSIPLHNVHYHTFTGLLHFEANYVASIAHHYYDSHLFTAANARLGKKEDQLIYTDSNFPHSTSQAHNLSS